MKHYAFAFALFAQAVALPALAQDSQFTLVNNSGFDLIRFYASPTNVSDWEGDILGQDILPDGNSVNITIADGRRTCDYDIKMEFSDGDELTDRIDVCTTGSYTIN